MKITTINKCIAELKKLDNSCCLTSYGLRQMVKNGEIHSFYRGNRCLIDLDQVINYMGFNINPEPVVNDVKVNSCNVVTPIKHINRFKGLF